MFKKCHIPISVNKNIRLKSFASSYSLRDNRHFAKISQTSSSLRVVKWRTELRPAIRTCHIQANSSTSGIEKKDFRSYIQEIRQSKCSQYKNMTEFQVKFLWKPYDDILEMEKNGPVNWPEYIRERENSWSHYFCEDLVLASFVEGIIGTATFVVAVMLADGRDGDMIPPSLGMAMASLVGIVGIIGIYRYHKLTWKVYDEQRMFRVVRSELHGLSLKNQK